MSTMQSLKSQDGSVYISFPDKKKPLFLIKIKKKLNTLLESYIDAMKWLKNITTHLRSY